MRIIYTKKFVKDLKKCDLKIKQAFKTRLKAYLANKSDSILNNHSLNGELKKYRSINISGDYRAIFQELENGTIVCFMMIGKHAKLYD